MNINYDDIITKANERKNTLKEFEAATVDLDFVLKDAAGVYTEALQRYKQACDRLDAEAHKMLPDNAPHLLNRWVNDVLNSQSQFIRVYGSSGYTTTPQQALNKLLGS